jgi:hypothetical protein
LVLRLNQETVHDFILLFMPPCSLHLTPLATGSLERSLLVFSTPGGFTGDDLSLLFFTKNQSTQRCPSLITQGSDHPPVLEPHMVLKLSCIGLLLCMSGLYWPDMHEDTKRYVASCHECQRTRNISQRNSMPLRYNLQIDLFDVWGIDFMGPFKNSHGYEHILVMVDYVSKWVEAMPCRKASTEESIAMIKNMIFPRFGTPRILISDGGTHFTGKNFKKCLCKLGIEHRVSEDHVWFEDRWMVASLCNE